MSATPPRCGGLPGRTFRTAREPRERLRPQSGWEGVGGPLGSQGWSSPAREWWEDHLEDDGR